MERTDLKHAEQALLELGIEHPREIDVVAIAKTQGVSVRVRRLDSCDALIMGRGDRGIITVSASSAPQRQRFSIAHELGHWRYHRHRISMCVAADIERGNRRASGVDDERVADRYASELLMPTYLLRPAVGRIARLDWPLVRRIAETFNTSLPATAIRLVEANLVPSLLVCHRAGGKRAWFVRAKDVPDHWFPQDQLDARSSAFELAFGKVAAPSPNRVTADVWFDRWNADRFTLHEQPLLSSNHDVLCLLNITDARMMDDG